VNQHAHFLPTSPAPSPPAPDSNVCSPGASSSNNPSRSSLKLPCTDRRKAAPRADAGNYAAAYTYSAAISFPHQVGFGRFHHQMRVVAHQHPRMQPSSPSADTPLPAFGKIRPYQPHRGKCAPADFPAPSGGKKLLHIRCGLLEPLLTSTSTMASLSRFVD